jgi:hypothetical protein
VRERTVLPRYLIIGARIRCANTGPVDDQFLSEIRQKCHEDNVNFGKKFESADRLVALLATIEVALETFTGRYLNMVIFGLTSYLSEKMNQADDVGPYESEKVDQEARLNARTFFTNVPHLSPQLYAAVNRMRSKVLSVSVLFATLNVFTDMYLLQPHQQEVVVDAHDSQNATLNRGREIRNFIESISGVLRMALVCLIVHRLINARVNQHFIDYASFLFENGDTVKGKMVKVSKNFILIDTEYGTIEMDLNTLESFTKETPKK